MDRDSPALDRRAIALIAAALCSPAAWSAGPTVAFQIPAGNAPQTLREFYLQSRVRVLYLADTVRGVETRPVSGTLEASEALARMLEGTGLAFEFENEFSAVIRPSESLGPMPYAESTPAAPGAGPSVPVPPPGKIEEMLVTGSYIHGVFDITSPLVPMEKEQIRRATYANVQDALSALPFASTITRGEVIGGPGNFGLGAGINLRGLGDGATLVNGRRQPAAGTRGDFVDVSNVPWSMVERIEVLPDGGSALYGSDAIAGIANIILRTDIERAETQVRIGSARNGASELLASQLVGHHWKNGKWLLGYQYYARASLAAADRAYAADADKSAFGGRNFRSINSNPGNILDPQTLRPAFAIPEGQDGKSLRASDLLPGTANYRNQFANAELLPDKVTHHLYFTGSQQLTENLQVFAEGRFANRRVRQRPVASDESVLIRVPDTNPFFVDPFGNSSFITLAYDFERDLGQFEIRGAVKSALTTIGLERTLGETWRASLSTSYGAESLRWSDSGRVNLQTLSAALADPDPQTAFNPFADGSHSNPETIHSISAHNSVAARSEIFATQFLMDGDLFELPSGIVKAALGAEHRYESLVATYRDEVFGRPLTKTSTDRSTTAMFGELAVPLIGDPTDFRNPPRLELSLAARYEQYDGFKSTLTPKLGLRWTPTRSLKLRTSWSTSFRAPNLADLDDSNNISILTPLMDPQSPSGRSEVLGLQGGNTDLREERATTWTVGLDLAPTALRGFTGSLTAYAINYADQVIQPGPQNVLNILLNEEQWAPVINRNPSPEQIDAICTSPEFLGSAAQCIDAKPSIIVDIRKRNLAITRLQGLDMTLSQSVDTNLGSFRLELQGSHVFYFKRALTSKAPLIDLVDTVDHPLALRMRGSLQWFEYGPHQHGFSAMLTANYTGSYSNMDSPLRHKVGAWTTFDIGLGFKAPRAGLLAGTEFVLNVNNLTDEAPPIVDQVWGFDVINSQPLGRVLSFHILRKW